MTPPGYIAAFLSMKTSAMVLTAPTIEQVIATIALDAAHGSQPAYRVGTTLDRIVVEVVDGRHGARTWATIAEVSIGTYDLNAHGALLAAELRAGATRALR